MRKMTRFGRTFSRESDLMLSILLAIRKPGQRYTHKQLARILGVSHGTIFNIETQAIKKMRRAANADPTSDR